jgi:hypothetical protein
MKTKEQPKPKPEPQLLVNGAPIQWRDGIKPNGEPKLRSGIVRDVIRFGKEMPTTAVKVEYVANLKTGETRSQWLNLTEIVTP